MKNELKLKELLLRHEMRNSESLCIYVDAYKLGHAYKEQNPGMFMENAYILHPSGCARLKHYDRKTQFFIPDDDWSVRLKLMSTRVQDIYDSQSLGIVLDEQGQGMKNFAKIFYYALEYECCTRLDDALDIAEDLGRYELAPVTELKKYAEDLLKQQHVELPQIVAESFDYEGYAAELLKSQGYILSCNEEVYIGKDRTQQLGEMSLQ